MKTINYEIQEIAKNCNSREKSVRKIGETAKRYLEELKKL